MLTLTPPLVTAVAEWKGGLSSRNAITSGLLLAQTSKFSLVVGLYALQMGRIPSQVMSAIMIIAVVTMTITPLIGWNRVASLLLQFHPVRRRLRTLPDLHDHVLMLGLGSEGMHIVQPLRDSRHHVVVVDHDPVRIQHPEKAGIPWIRGDATDDKVLRRAGFSHAKRILVSMPNVQDALRALQCSRPLEVPVIVSVFEEEHADEIEKYGGIPVLNSHAAADSFMEWFEDVFSVDVRVCSGIFIADR